MSQNEQTLTLHQYLNGVITNIPFGVITIAKDLDISMINENAIHLLGFDSLSPASFVDTPYANIFEHIQELQNLYEKKVLNLRERKFDMHKFVLNDKVLNIKCRAMLHGTLFIIEDFTTQSKLEEELHHQANHDSLTNLINRKQLQKRLEDFAARNAESTLVGAVIFIDLDRFKPVNDVAGHTAGDTLLKNIAAMMNTIIRDRDTLSRVGGDEFIILLENCPLSRAVSIAEKIRKTIDEYIFVWEGNSFNIGISAGVSIITHEMKSPCAAIELADQACLIAKNEGRNRVHVADDAHAESQEHKKEISWINIINSAIKDDNFILYAQEICAIQKDDEHLHYELLLRLSGEDNEVLSPASFMPAAERYELMTKIDEWVINKAFEMVKSDTYYSINLSGQTMSNPSITEYIINLEQKYGINPSQITFEITESMAIKYFANTKNIMKELIQRGYKFSLDDFGTGLSSYAYLKKMPVAFLKIDGIFTKEIADDIVSYTMVKSINEIGHVMGLKTIAEFVENEEILQKLREIGVDYAQGYHVHKPEPLEETILPRSSQNP